MIVNIHYGLLVFIANRCQEKRAVVCVSFSSRYRFFLFSFCIFLHCTCFRKYFNEFGKYLAMKIFDTRFCVYQLSMYTDNITGKTNGCVCLCVAKKMRFSMKFIEFSITNYWRNVSYHRLQGDYICVQTHTHNSYV